MKIAVFHNLSSGGAKRVVDQQVKFLNKTHQVKLFQLNLTFKGSRLTRDWQNFYLLNQKHKKLAQQINQADFDICLTHPDKLTQAPFLLKYLKIKSIYYCHELLRIAYEPELAIHKNLPSIKKLYEKLTRKLRKQIDKSNAQSADLILTNSKYTQKNIRKAYRKQSAVCYPGVDPQIFKPSAKGPTSQLIFIGAKVNILGYNLAEKALKLIDKKIRPRLTVVDKFNLTDKKLAQLYSQSLASLCLSYHEPFGLASIESMACQTPVIAVNQGGYKETVVNNKTGFLIKRNPEILAKKITYLIKHPQTRKNMGIMGRKHVLKEFTWQIHNRNLTNHLTKLNDHET